MGEIAEALRRAHTERVGRDDASDGSRHTPAEPVDDVYSASLRVHAAEQANRDREAGARPGAVGRLADLPISSESALPEPSAVRLTHERAEAQVPQGVLIDGGGPITDACLQLALRVRKALEDRGAATLVIVSGMRNEGKTTVSCNLALALAFLGHRRVALVDLDLRRPSLQTVLELYGPGRGIEDVLAGDEPLESARIHIAPPDLDVFVCRRGQARAHELLLLPSFGRVVRELRARYDIVIFDSPPTLLVPDASIIMQHVECYAPVARAGITRARNFRRLLDVLPRRGLLGPILDGGPTPVGRGYYEHYAPDAPAEIAASGDPDAERTNG